VNLLFSPTRTPRYNASIEAGNGSLKTRTERHAAQAGHPAYWTFDDVEHARAEANSTARPHGPIGPTPNQLWETRRPITMEQRSAFQIRTVLDNSGVVKYIITYDAWGNRCCAGSHRRWKCRSKSCLRKTKKRPKSSS